MNKRVIVDKENFATSQIPECDSQISQAVPTIEPIRRLIVLTQASHTRTLSAARSAQTGTTIHAVQWVERSTLSAARTRLRG